MTITATRATARDLGRARKAYANQVEEATGYSIAWEFCPLMAAWVFWLVDPCGDRPDGPFTDWGDLVDFCQDAIDEYEELYASIEPKFYEGCNSDDYSDADPGL